MTVEDGKLAVYARVAGLDARDEVELDRRIRGELAKTQPGVGAVLVNGFRAGGTTGGRSCK
ncbi:MAG: hypothetical protein ABL926_00430 [Novosphingobium sp.]|uniref:hypothetical protein n=1 Tax=Novosphingobium sp. TaxID=1874826 RepID=UPI0032B87082